MAKVIKPPASFDILGISIMVETEGINILYIPNSTLKLIEIAGRTAYQSYNKIKEGSEKRFVEMIIKRGHESVLEHSALTVRFRKLSRGATHELVRHRLASYTQRSTRYVVQKDFVVVIPPDKDSSQEISITIQNQKFTINLQDWFDLNQEVYQQLIEKGWPPEDARQVLPTGIISEIVVTANFREWRHIFEVRCAPEAHWEIRLTMVQLLKRLKQIIPVVFDDFEISPDETYARKIRAPK